MLLLAAAIAAVPLHAQTHTTVAREAEFRKEPSDVVLGSILPGTRVILGRTSGDWIEARLAGWIYTPSTSADRREGFDVSVSARPTENLRAEPNGTILAKLVTGALLSRDGKRGAWTQVHRTGWIPRSAVGRGAPSAARDTARAGSPSRADTALGPAPRAGALDRAQMAKAGAILTEPGGETVATVGQGTPVRVRTTADGWARVQVEGWMRVEDLETVPDSTVLAGVTAAEVRAEPDRYEGRTLQWRVQFLALQRADELRPEIPSGQPYLLTRGPLPEAGFVYIQVSPAQVEQFRALAPLAELTVRGRLKSAVTRYLPNPVLVLESIVP